MKKIILLLLLVSCKYLPSRPFYLTVHSVEFVSNSDEDDLCVVFLTPKGKRKVYGFITEDCDNTPDRGTVYRITMDKVE